ncbi:MAG: methylase involved in ubiquinone/menaquinone biosynthesis [Chloroflexi bacterium]|nr:methylase involved in ubiquinone/menaquinone biosynthesis [Chloroflexota bacterium]
MFSETKFSPFPALYHAHHSQHLEDLPFWLALADSLSKSYRFPILELGCGTGRILLPLAQAGHTVFGLDNDRAMLRFLSERLAAGDRPLIHLIQADMTQFHLAARFELIILPCNTLSTLSQPALMELFACISRHLLPGGAFVASLPNPQLLLHLPKKSGPEFEETFPHPLDGEPVQVSSAWQRDGQTFTVSWYYDHWLPDGRIEHLQTLIKHQIEPVQFYLHGLKDVGFDSIQLFGDFDRRPYRRTSTDLIIVARKPLP